MKFMPWEKIKSTIPREQNHASWLVKNCKTVFSKLTWQISLSVSGKPGEQSSEHLASSFPFSNFQILSSHLGCYFSGISCRLVLFLGKCLMDSSQVLKIFTEVWPYFHVSVSSSLKFLSVLYETMFVQKFVFRENWAGSKVVAGMKTMFFAIFDPI